MVIALNYYLQIVFLLNIIISFLQLLKHIILIGCGIDIA